MRLLCRTMDDGGVGGDPTDEVDQQTAPASVAAPADNGWNGELESLSQQPWWGRLDPEVRPAVEAGLRAKHSNWQSGYQAKIRAEAVTARATAENTLRGEYDAKISAAEQRAATAERKANSFTEFFGEGSTADTAAQEELAKAQAELDRLRGIETDKTAWEQERADLARERDELKTWREQREAAEMDLEVQKFVTTNEDLLADDDARAMLETLIETRKMDADEAVAKVRRLFERAGAAPKVASTQERTVQTVQTVQPVAPPGPDPIDMMSPGDTTNGSIRGPHKEMSLYEAAGIAYKNRRISG